MKVVYFWMEISDDGLLREPKPCGPYYSKEHINWYGGFDSREEAIAEYKSFKKRYKWSISDGLILVERYYPNED